ncbi:MAG TPA: hypothetical protein VGN88_04825, partial [Phycisphaerae bacterium]
MVQRGFLFGVLAAAIMASLGAAPAPAPVKGALVTGWSLLKEGDAAGTVEMDAKNPANPDPHLLKIAVTKYVDAGKGRLGAKNSADIAVKEGQSYDITFNGTSEGIGVGLVFSLETEDGKVLARTTLPEIGRGGRGGGGGRGRGAGRGRGGAAAGDT